MNLLDLAYVIHLVWTFMTFVTLWEDNNSFKNLFALYINNIKTYYHPCMQGNPRQSWILDSSLFCGTWIPDYLGCILDSKAQDSRFHKQNFLRFRNFRIPLPAATIQSDLQSWRFYAALLRIKQQRSSRHRMKPERLVQTDELGGEGHNAKKTWSRLLAFAPTDNCKLRF